MKSVPSSGVSTARTNLKKFDPEAWGFSLRNTRSKNVGRQQHNHKNRNALSTQKESAPNGAAKTTQNHRTSHDTQKDACALKRQTALPKANDEAP